MAQKNSTQQIEFVSVEQISELLGIPIQTTYAKVRKINEQLAEQGFLTVRGSLPKSVYNRLTDYQNADLSKISL